MTATVNLTKMRALRVARGLTQSDMAKALGYKTDLGYHYLETGKRRMTVDHLGIIAAVLEVSIMELLDTADCELSAALDAPQAANL